MKYSIIICTFKNVEYTRICLDSLIPYLTKDIECIVIDDGSNNEMGNILMEYQKKHPSIQAHIHSDNTGPIQRRNEGLAYATGDYILFMDNDTVWTGNVVEVLQSHMAKLPNCGIVGMCGILMPSIHSSIHIHQTKLANPIEVHAVPSYCMLVKRDLVVQGLRFDSQMKFIQHEDVDYCLQASQMGVTIYAVPNIPLTHTEHGSLAYYSTEFTYRFEFNWKYLVTKWQGKISTMNNSFVNLQLKALLKNGMHITKTKEIPYGIFYDIT